METKKEEFSEVLLQCILNKSPLALDVWKQQTKYSHMKQYLHEVFKNVSFKVFQEYVVDRMMFCTED